MSYFNYHAKAKKLISTNHLIDALIVEKYHSIAPALILYFDNHKPMPIRDYKWNEYIDLIKPYTEIKDPDSILYRYLWDTGNL